MHVAILSNDVVPGMGLPVAAPGIRVWGMAEGLRAHGHQVTVLVDQWLVNKVWDRALPPPLPRHTVVLMPKRIREYLTVHGIDALVVTNSNHVEAIGELPGVELIYDFFAPKMLELSENTDRPDLEQAKENLARRKTLALSRSSAVVSNGAKKLAYVRDWMERAGVGDLPLDVVNPGLEPVDPHPPADGPLQVIVSGYLQPWSRPGAWARAVKPLLDSGKITLHLLVGSHWGQTTVAQELPEELQKLVQHKNSVRHGLLRLGDFRDLLSRCHLSIDVFERNPERELAMVTRTVVALSCGLPVMHVDFTEVSGWIAEYGAGWLVDPDDADGMEEILQLAAEDPSLLRPRREGAERIAHEVLAPAVAAEPLARILDRLEQERSS